MLGSAPHQSLMAMSEKYGKIMRLRMGVFPTVVVSSPDLAREVLKVQDQHLASRPHFESGKILAYDNQSTSLTPNNDKWRFMRKVITTELVSAKRIEQSKSIRREELLNTIEDILSDGHKGELVDFDAKLTALVLNQTTRFNFRRRYYGTKRKDIAEGAEAFQALVKEIGGTSFFFPGEFFPFLMFLDLGGVEARMRKLAHTADQFYSSILASHRNKDGSYIYKETLDQDFVDVLLACQRENNSDISDEMIKAAIQDVIIASSSTSSATMLWTLAELMRHPDMLRRVQKELDTVVGKNRLAEESDLVNLEYLRAVIKETFRLHPVLPLLLPHQSDVDVQIGGYDIPAKTRVMVNTYAIGRDPQVWEDPLEFNPDRFLNSPIDVKGQNFELLPFGAGRRMCVGYNLGLMTVENGLAQLLHTCDLNLPEGMSPKDVSMVEVSGASVTRSEVLQLRVTPRLPAHVYTQAGMSI
ncbi:protein MpCYP829F2 [Marchantia polymorpha subsp. ruderalis]|uniref:Cytochrome P450 n=2 Tax=Marchantia polymorpha TaxID=3197 RepID=A0AAF6BXA3_MARPO|nr:hypothetical protein MARPO_0146s0007 [Marchantia polymorpha]BBN16637.1 hypothetical protein Mp_7g08070 [Marchantia polymorpha subsp. ruderalis]|eukprot:PTQ29184.1 hypothetical protein MARPO_0146s0007 [Marchantia polymorpha]